MISFAKATKALSKYSHIYSRGWKWVMFARKLIKEENVKVISVWCNSNKHYDWVEKPNIMNESAYDDCIRMELTSDKTNILMKIGFYDGDLTYGQPRGNNFRCMFTLVLTKMYPELNSVIMRELNKQAVFAIEKEEEKERQARIKNKVKCLLDEL